MAINAIKKQKSLMTMLKDTLIAIKDNFSNLMLSIFITTCILLTTTLILFLIYYVLVFQGIINADNVFTSNLIWKTAGSIIYFIIAIGAQLLLINILINPKDDFKNNLKSITAQFWKFLFLTIILYILFMFFSLPIYVGITLIILNNTLLGIFSFFLGILLAIFLVTYLVFSPFILIEQKTSCFEAIKKSISYAQKNLINLILKLVFLLLIIALLNIISTALIPFMALGKIYYFISLLNIILVIAMILIFFTYLFVLYKEFK